MPKNSYFLILVKGLIHKKKEKTLFKITNSILRCCIVFIIITMMFGCRSLEEIGEIFIPPDEYTFLVDAPPKYSESWDVQSIQVESFTPTSGNSKPYAGQLKNIIETGIANEGYIAVVDRNADAIVTGSINFGKIYNHGYTQSYRTKKGTYHRYYYSKKFTVTGMYSMTDRKKRKVVIGEPFTFNYKDEWSSSNSSAEAKAKALTDEQFFQKALTNVATRVVYAVTPHKEKVTRRLEKGGDGSIKQGNIYLEKGRPEQALNIWEQVSVKTESREDKAACQYNIGVVKEARGEYGEAFRLFSAANQLCPERELYIEAMTRVEDAEKERKRLDVIRGK